MEKLQLFRGVDQKETSAAHFVLNMNRIPVEPLDELSDNKRVTLIAIGGVRVGLESIIGYCRIHPKLAQDFSSLEEQPQ